MLRLKSSSDLGAGILLVVIPLAFLIAGWNLEHGNLVAMGPGHFPRYVAGLALLIGLVLIGKSIVVASIVVANTALPKIAFRPLACVLASVAFFGFTIDVLGLPLTTIFTIILASLAAPGLKWHRIAMLAVCMSVFVSLVFVKGLGLPIPLWPQF
jgi:hypothetical protein